MERVSHAHPQPFLVTSNARSESNARRRWRLPSFLALQVGGLVAFWLVAGIFSFKASSDLTSRAFWELAILNIVLSLGILLGSLGRTKTRANRLQWESLDTPPVLTVLRIVQTVAWIGVVFRLIDRFVLRPELIGANIDTVDTDSTLLGALASLLYPIGLSVLPLVLAISFTVPRRTWLSAFLLFFFPAFDVMLVGKRGIAVTLLGMFILLLFSSGLYRKWRALIPAAAIGAIALASFGFVIQRRLTSYNMSMCYSLYNSTYAYAIQPNEATEKLCANTDFFSTIGVYITNFAMYFVHGFYEFSLGLRDALANQDLTWGASTFGIFTKPFCIVWPDSTICSPSSSPFREGVYTTFWGPWLQDFGPYAMPAAFLLGLALAFLQRAAHKSFAWLPTYLYLGTVVFFMPVVNLIQSGLGAYVLVGCIAFAAIYNWRVNSHGKSRIR